MKDSSKIIFIIIMLSLGAFACANDDDDSNNGFVYPDPDWIIADPAQRNLDPAGLEIAANFAEEQNSNCFVVIRDGYLVGEWYWKDWTPDSQQGVFSTTKSFTSAVVGIAQDQGYLSIRDSAADYIDAWKGTPSEAVTIQNLLSNDSGREWDFLTDYLEMAGEAEDKTGFAISLGQQREPGTWWEYNNSAIQSLDRVVNVATGMDMDLYANENLFEPIGSNAHFSRDVAGNTLTFNDLQTSCRDMARFGYLYLRNGQWNGKQIISEAFVAESTVPSTPLNYAYGYLWWLNKPGPWVGSTVFDNRPEGNGQRMPGLTEDSYAALGMFDQIIFVDPGSNIVITRIGGTTGDVESFASGGFTSDLVQRVMDARTD